MKTAEQTLLNAIQHGYNEVDAMRNYALQEVEKHLQIAADKCRKMDEYFDKESITGIKIELT